MDLFGSDPILKNSHFYFEMTREEKMEYHYEKLPRILEMAPEDITYKNIFNYVLLCGTVSFITSSQLLIKDTNRVASCDVRASRQISR
jgi:hypothetical protein